MSLSSRAPPWEPKWAKALAMLAEHPPPRTAAWCAERDGSTAGPSRLAVKDPTCLLLTMGSWSGLTPPERYAVTCVCVVPCAAPGAGAGLGA
eukprot:9487073-Lingulodinium_polyedra.AAC.1